MYIYNFLVNDIMPVKNMKDMIIIDKLYKQSYEHILTGFKMDWCNYNKTYDIPQEMLKTLEDKARKQHKTIGWEEHNPYYEDTKSIYNRSKNICIIQPAAACKFTWGRLGSIDY